MKRVAKIQAVISIALCAFETACGAPALSAAPEGFIPGDNVTVVSSPQNAPEPWLLEWGGDARRSLASQLSSGIALVRYEQGKLTLLPLCTATGQYQGGTAKNRPLEEKTLSNENDLYAKLGIKLIRVKASFEQGETWSLKYVVADDRRASIRAVSKAEVPVGCEQATHYVSQAFFGAYVLDTGAGQKFDGAAGAEIPVVDAEIGGSSGGTASLVKSDGDLAQCQNLDTPMDAPACQGILKIGLLPIGE